MAAAVKTEHPYVIKNSDICGGSPTIAGTRISVSLIASRLKYGNSAEDILRDYPHLSLAGIHDAISYYFDHKDEIDQEIRGSAIREMMKRHDLRLIPGDNGVDRLVTEEELKSLPEEERDKAFTWETLPDKYD